MKITLERKPFNEFWMNCMLNQAFSIAESVHPSYRHAAYLNIYRYFRWEAATDAEFRYPTIDTLYYMSDTEWAKFPLTSIIQHIEPRHFRNPDDFIEEIREVLRSGCNLSLNVDLFDWLPDSMAWQKFHWYHYSLFNGYDDESGNFYVIDDTLAGYDEHEVTEEQVRKAYRNSEYCVSPGYPGPAYYVYHLHPQVEPYELKLAEVKENAARLAEELAEFTMDGMWNVDPGPEKFQSHMTYALIGINIICNRHTANAGLIRTLHEQGQLDDELFQTLDEQLQLISEGWNLLKQRFAASQFERDREVDLAERLFAQEGAFWGLLAAEA